MKSKWERIKELYNNKYTKPLLFFGFYIIFFTIIIVAFSTVDRSNNHIVESNPWDYITNNYEYLYEIDSNNNIVTLEGKQYGNKNLFNKKVNNVLTDEVYTFYNDIYVKSNSEWINNNNYVLVSGSFDNKYMDINYIKSLIVDAELMNSTTNFDESITETYKINDLNIEVVSVNNEIKKITLVLPLYKIILQYKNINRVQDFVVEK
jgi:hypothetical protein